MISLKILRLCPQVVWLWLITNSSRWISHHPCGYHSLSSRWSSKGHFTHKVESPWLLHFKHSYWWEKAEPVQVRFILRLRDQWSEWMQDDRCKVYTDSYMASNGSCFVVTWTIYKNHLLEVGLTQNHWETMTLRMLTIVDLFYFIMCENLRK